MVLRHFSLLPPIFVMPLLAGYFIAAVQKFRWLNGEVENAYYVITALVILLTLLSSLMNNRESYKNPPAARFIYFKFHRLWTRMLYMAVFKGVSQGFIITAPVMLIMKVVGNGGALGAIQATGALLSAVMLYVGRKARAEHWMKIFAAGLFLFVLGAFLNMTMYSVLGVVLFVTCLVFSRPLLDLAYFPIQLGVTECVATKEGRSQLSYIFSHEIGLFTGRLFGCGLFMMIGLCFGDEAALRYALFAVAVIQFFSLFIAGMILKDREWCEAEKIPLAENDLKEPSEL